jgi:DNA-binding response OmpR family regulator
MDEMPPEPTVGALRKTPQSSAGNVTRSQDAGPVLVLVVEDESLILLMVKEALEAAGFGVLEASTGASALKFIEDKTRPVRALVTDVDLGVNLTGWVLAQRAREISPELPVVYITGGGPNEWPSHGVPKSMLVTKPFAPAQLVTAVSQLLNAAITDPSTSAPT